MKKASGRSDVCSQPHSLADGSQTSRRSRLLAAGAADRIGAFQAGQAQKAQEDRRKLRLGLTHAFPLLCACSVPREVCINLGLVGDV